MAIDIVKGTHIVAFPSKLKSTFCGHIFNIITQSNTDNGTLAKKGDYVSFDNYEAGDAPSNFAGVILEQSTSDGGWYVEVTTPDDALFLYNSPISPYSEKSLQDNSLFFNEEGDVVQGMELCKGDVFNVSANAFTGTPVAGKSVTYSNGKYVVGN